MQKTQHYILGQWVDGQGEGTPILDSVTGEHFTNVTTEGIDAPEVLQYGRVKGEALRKMTFQERGNMLKKLAFHLQKHKRSFYEISYRSGCTKIDSWIDIEGGFGNLFANASLRKLFPNQPFDVEGEPIDLSRGGKFMAHHILVPKNGVAVHINAFNFPVWGMLEKCAVNWMAGMPAVVLPAPQSAYLTEAVVKVIIASGILPEGALQLISGTKKDIFDTIASQDVVTFTGSAATGRKLKTHPRLIEESVPFTMEADSLNACILGEDAVPGTPEFNLFIKEVRNEMTVKCGQKCTAIRRIIVPEKLVEDVQIALGQALDKVTYGDPRLKEVRMGTLIDKKQVESVKNQVQEIAKTANIVYGDFEGGKAIGADFDKGAFIKPILLREDHPFSNEAAHITEAFGPVSTLMPYKDLNEAIELSRKGKGSLVSSIATNDNKVAAEYTVKAATHHGRILVLNRESAKQSTGHGSPLPNLIHGGPGRAGGGEEMGGKRGILHYLQRTAIQGHPTTISNITNQYQVGGKQNEAKPHVFRKHFEELEIGETVFTDTHTVSLKNIEDFAELSGDKFYAHMDENALEGTIFTERVAHGYYILSRAAGLFVDPPKGPVLLNYGIDECRFTKPVYPGMTIAVRFTVKEKIEQEKKPDDDIAKGIVKFLVDVYDDENETVMMATILTMIKKKNQD